MVPDSGERGLHTKALRSHPDSAGPIVSAVALSDGGQLPFRLGKEMVEVAGIEPLLVKPCLPMKRVRIFTFSGFLVARFWTFLNF